MLEMMIFPFDEYVHSLEQKRQEKVIQKISQVVLTLAEITLRDEFGFSKARLEKFADRLDEKADCIAKGYTTVEEQIEILKKETGMLAKLE